MLMRGVLTYILWLITAIIPHSYTLTKSYFYGIIPLVVAGNRFR